MTPSSSHQTDSTPQPCHHRRHQTQQQTTQTRPTTLHPRPSCRSCPWPKMQPRPPAPSDSSPHCSTSWPALPCEPPPGRPMPPPTTHYMQTTPHPYATERRRARTATCGRQARTERRVSPTRNLIRNAGPADRAAAASPHNAKHPPQRAGAWSSPTQTPSMRCMTEV